MKYLIIGHGGFAAGTKKTVEFLVGEREDVLTLDIGPEAASWKEQLQDLTKDCGDEGLTVFTDMLGSEAHQYCLELRKEKPFRLVSGYNVALLLEALLADEMTDEELEELVGEMKDQLVYVNDLFKNM